MSEINTTKAASNIRRRIKSSKHFEGFKLGVFETSRQTKCFRTVCYFERSPIDINFSTYSYNPNSFISFQFFKQSQFQNQYEYNSRNWITSMNSLQGLFGFTNTYYKTGNVNTQLLFGTYKDNFPQNNYNLYYNYTYDNSNRLLNAINTNQGDMSFSVLNTYDKDGNITTLKRYGDNNVITDDFNYQYYSGTNKLSKVSEAIDQYSYDLNGNVTRDTINYNFNIQYDHRNLITQFYHTDREAVSRPYTYATRYYYDESGNRVRKLEYFNTQTNPPLITDWDNPGNGWTLSNNEFYVKGADGKDLATYQGSELEDWYVWGNDLVGKIRKDKPYYYFKDHLGSVRAIVNEEVQIVAAFDYDAWGYPLEGRTYNADSIKFKYTGKELDKESLYDYFGARYFDSRIGRWGTTDPLMEKHIDYTPYNYVLDNPIVLIDPEGEQVFVAFGGYGLFQAADEIDPIDYSNESSSGAKVLLKILTEYKNENNFQDLRIKGFNASFEKSEISAAYDFITKDLSNSSEPIALYGLSLGGSNINELADLLIENGIENPIFLITVDAFNLNPGFSGLSINSKVSLNYNFYQENRAFIFGSRGFLSKSDAKNVVNFKVTNVSHYTIDEATNSRISDDLRSYFNRWRIR
jgi:RHS repeat-associated protein